MKTLFSSPLFIWLMVFQAFVSACEKDQAAMENSFRVILPSGLSEVAYAGRELAFDIEVNAPAGLDKVETRINFQPVEGSQKTDFEDPVTDTYRFTFTPDQFDIGKKLTFVIAAYDKRGHTTTATYEVMVETPPVNIDMHFPGTEPDTILLGEHVGLDILVSSELELRKIETLLGGEVIDSLTMTDFQDPLTASYRFSYTSASEDAGNERTFIIRATDEEGKSKEVAYVVFVKGDRVPQPVLSYTAELGAQLNTETGHFLDLTDGSVHLRQGVAAISAEIDLLLFYSSSSKGNLTAPDFGNAAQYIYTQANSGEDALGLWPVRNDTKLSLVSVQGVTEADFEAVEMDDALATIYEQATSTSNAIASLAEGAIIAFLTADNKYGLILVKKVPENNADNMILEVKVQK